MTVFDFKTTRRPPSNVDTIPTGTIRQMAAYVAALEAIYPGGPPPVLQPGASSVAKISR